MYWCFPWFSANRCAQVDTAVFQNWCQKGFIRTDIKNQSRRVALRSRPFQSLSSTRVQHVRSFLVQIWTQRPRDKGTTRCFEMHLIINTSIIVIVFAVKRHSDTPVWYTTPGNVHVIPVQLGLSTGDEWNRRWKVNIIKALVNLGERSAG